MRDFLQPIPKSSSVVEGKFLNGNLVGVRGHAGIANEAVKTEFGMSTDRESIYPSYEMMHILL